MFPVSDQKCLFGVAEDGVVPALAGLAEELDHNVFDLGVLFKGEQGHVFANTALFIAAMGNFRGKWALVVAPYAAELKEAAGTHGCVGVSRPHGRSTP